MSIHSISDSTMRNLQNYYVGVEKRYYEKLRGMSSDDRMIYFLQRCNQPGIRNRRKRYPTHTEVGNWCGCSKSTIGRIASKQTENVSRGISALLHALAGVCPHAAIDENLHREIMSRVRDAGDAYDPGRTSVDDVLVAVLSGIESRSNKIPAGSVEELNIFG